MRMQQQYCGVVLKQLRSQRPGKHQSGISTQYSQPRPKDVLVGKENRIRIFSYIPKGGTYQREGRIKVNIKDLKPKRIKRLLGVQDQPKESCFIKQDALPKSESAEKICPGRTRCLLSRHPLCHPAQADYRSP
ncbi:hypothetical protein GQ457_09G000010 [Hibiscus cannabinus]